jgi:hypothetical protein
MSPVVVANYESSRDSLTKLNQILHPISLIKNKSSKTFVFLSGHQLFSQPYPKNLAAEILSNDLGCNFCFVKDFTCSWFSRGILGLTPDLQSSSTWLREFLASHSLRADYVGGFSSGAYAAIVTGVHMEARKIFAFGAQTIINNDVIAAYSNNNPWTEASLFDTQKFTIPVDLVDFLGSFKKLPEIHLFVGAECDSDIQHAERLSAFDAVTVHRIAGVSDHQVLNHMLRKGLLRDFFSRNL